MTRPFSRVIDAVAEIARKMGGTVVNKGDRLADNLEAIAEVAGSGGGGGGGLVVETELVAGTASSNPAFKSNVLGVDLRAAIASGQNVVVHIPGSVSDNIGELYFSPILELTDGSGQANTMMYRLPDDKNGNVSYTNLMDGDDDNKGYVKFDVYTD